MVEDMKEDDVLRSGWSSLVTAIVATNSITHGVEVIAGGDTVVDIFNLSVDFREINGGGL